MNILIIEDEIKAARSLENLILKLRPETKIIAKIQSVEAAIDYLSNSLSPDIIFMDIQLSDGISFDIFKSVKIVCPVIFCTAFGEYAMDAIKENGIDYLLKPFSETDLKNAFEKVDNFKNFFQKTSENNLIQLIQKISGEETTKKSFLVFKNNKYLTVKTADIAYIYINYTSPTIVTFKGEHFDVNQSLDQLAAQLSDKDFFRLNRQYLISFSAVKEVEHYFARKLYIKLTVPTDEKLLIGKEKTTIFLNWLEDR
ncbi:MULTISPECIES: LytR/AlgR family response regulator transcription factor [Sphingobacterium]|uniref:DNA-binding response regulator n=1 Tax=Sphingobacterium athyrii TaxID=2152717 RepID=A0A363P0D6_9SPHI|nr:MULTISPECIES: LytTR family DNA-binding domain-containing protein [Sphingobacterium]PUV26460.1 DNA-binding response regulator [Sphingobacterium athyrii]QIH32666.1 response regulator transcription factor [Sphingobacterium sp. DR205]